MVQASISKFLYTGRVSLDSLDFCTWELSDGFGIGCAINVSPVAGLGKIGGDAFAATIVLLINRRGRTVSQCR